MKKKIIYATIAFISLLASSSPLSAQTPSVTTSGSITSTPDADGNYWFTFESYATGQYIETQSGPEQKTVDVVLVMDCSYGTTSGQSKMEYYHAGSTQNPTYSNVVSSMTNSFPFFYMHDDKKVYRIYEESAGYLYYQVGETKYYLSNDGSSVDKSQLTPGSVNLPAACIEHLFKRKATNGLSNTDINNWIEYFVTALQNTNSKNYINLGIVRYSGNYKTSNHLTEYNSNSQTTNTTLVKNLSAINNYVPSGTKKTIKDITGGGSYSHAEYGLQIASDVLASSENQKVVVLVTPNAPGESAENNGIVYSETVANNAKTIANSLKNSGTSIYTVGMEATKTDEHLSGFLRSISSTDTDDNSYYYFTNGVEEVMNTIMKKIANSIDNNSRVYQTETTTNISCDVEGESILQNTISGKFMLPDNAATKAKVQYATCTGGTYGSPTFGAVSDFSTGAPSVSVSDGKLVVTGFNYKDNWAGPSTVSGSTTYHGGKLVVRIPVTTAADNPGGASVAVGVTPSLTIGETSITAPAVSTNVALPNLTINASGLKSTENAIFSVTSTYKTSGSDGVQTSTDASRTFNVMVHGDNPVTLKALPVGTYSITPLIWPWEYGTKPSAKTNQSLTGEGATETFTYGNTATSPHHGEASASNK